jgi:hypothetical protein
MSASGDCGCGGSSAAVAVKGAGRCGSSCGCDVLMTGEGFVRPRFFGGMLLTEDDLQAAIDYSIAKRKLTNRHVIGAGVVCGLEVTCHPCDTGKVSVSPGYAIECCGNDILVSCPEEVDVIALVRDLRLRKGIDCGEPCADQPRQDYHLVVRYAEAPTEPVAPYAPDDCATGDCEYSRIREGYCFELRCDPPADAPSLIDALDACRPADNGTDETLTDVLRLAASHAAAERSTAGNATAGIPAAEASGAAAPQESGEEETQTAAEVERAFVSGAERIRDRILRDLGAGGRTTCDEYRKVSKMRFDGLTSESAKDAVALGQAYLRSARECSCAALHPPCPTCTDDAVALARVRVDGCHVIEVCALERRWVLSPRALGYWLPFVERLRPLLEQACCAALPGSAEPPSEVLSRLIAEVRTTAERAVEAFCGPPLDLRTLVAEVAASPAAAAAPVPAPAATGSLTRAQAEPQATAAVAGRSAEERSIDALEVRIEELTSRVDELTAARPSARVARAAKRTASTAPAGDEKKSEDDR